MKRTLTAALLAVGLVLTATPAYAVTANPRGIVVNTFPASSSVVSPKVLTAPWYHNGRKTVVSTSKCASGVADQGTFYRWARVSGGFMPVWGAPVYLIKCR
jgi:hypothetical protein